VAGANGAKGVTGQQGLTGLRGSTGPQGATGVLAVNTGYFWSTDTASIDANAPIPIETGSTVIGTGITLSGTSTVALAQPGAYLVSYQFQADANGGNETISCLLTLNGTAVPGSQIQSVTTNPALAQAESPSISNTIVIQVPTANSTLQLVNGPLGIDHVTNDAGSTTADVQVVRLS
jgi:hypothetical protein